MGGGYQNFVANATDRPNDPLDNQWASCKRNDGRDLVKSWLQKKHESGVKHQFVRTKTELNDIDTSDIEYLFGKMSIYGSFRINGSCSLRHLGSYYPPLLPSKYDAMVNKNQSFTQTKYISLFYKQIISMLKNSQSEFHPGDRIRPIGSRQLIMFSRPSTRYFTIIL